MGNLAGKVNIHAQALIDSAKSYYQYLLDSNLGLDEIRILRVVLKEQILILQLGKRLFSQEILMLEVTVDGKSKTYELNTSLEYNEELSQLSITLDSELSEDLHNHLKNSTLRLFSDLKFLVKNVWEFYEKHRDSLVLPNAQPLAIKDIPHYLSDHQKEALKLVFSKPLSYIWGPPGSGKTQVVLFEALYAYAQMNKRVCVIAPTNSALEQIFITLLEHFKKMDFELSNLLRLGIPTQRFLSLYPECCDTNILKQNQISLFSQPISSKERLKNALIIGMTLDGFIKRYDSLEIKFAHFFLDECAFTALAKACSILIGGSPITLFGDHKQLMPICEMPQKELKNRPEVNLWNLSALFIEEFFKASDFTKLQEKTPSHTPELSCVAKLCFTHRYGDNLAKLLDSYIYQMGLRGQDEMMEIYCIDSGCKKEADNNISENEIRTIKILYGYLSRSNFLDSLKSPQNTNNITDSLAIITPFVKQRKELQQQLSSIEVLTIHGSQGREWENVIFSPVSLNYYLTDSRQQNALFGLNVAISRTKKRLFVVCDLAFWLAQQNQFLRDLLLQSTKINLPGLSSPNKLQSHFQG